MRMTFYEFNMGDVDDVDIYVAQPIYEWQQTKHGQWVMKHGQDLRYLTNPDPTTLGYRISIVGDLPEGPHMTEYFLRWSKDFTKN